MYYGVVILLYWWMLVITRTMNSRNRTSTEYYYSVMNFRSGRQNATNDPIAYIGVYYFFGEAFRF